jgi:hypothetical protein
MAFLTREGLLKKQQLKIEKVDLGDGDYVYVREMTGQERIDWEQSIKEAEEAGMTVNAKFVICCICDKDGKNVLQPEDYKVLSETMSCARLIKIATAAGKLNIVTNKDKEGLAKNSAGGQAADLASDSVKT